MTGTDIAVRRPQASALPAKLEYAHELANSGLLPAAFRRNPANVLWAMEYADMLGLPPMVAMTGIHVIEGKPTASAGLISGLVRKARHKLRVTGDDKRAVAEITRCDDPDFTFRSEWTLERARQAELLGKSNWKKYPAAMLKARAITEAARDACEEALFGLQYTAEELGAVVDEDGAVVEGGEDGDEPPAQPQQPADPAASSEFWYTNPPPEQAAAEEWVTKTLALVPDIGPEACRTLWRETMEKGRSGDIPRSEAEKVLDALKARMEALAAGPQGAQEEPPAAAGSASADGLDPDDPWAEKVADLATEDDAFAAVSELADLLNEDKIDGERFGLVSAAIEARFPVISGEGKAA
jgi:hypothetical protein